MDLKVVYAEMKTRMSDTYHALTGSVARERAASAECISELERKIAEQKKDLMTDSLTGAYSNRFLHQCISTEIARQKRDKTYLWCALVLDLKKFKNINDSISYLAGNEALIQYVAYLKKTLRVQDSVIRRGGDEFFIILPETLYGQATHVITKKLTMSAHVHNLTGNEQIVLLEPHVQVCKGCSDKTVEEFIQLLDSLITSAKRNSVQ